MSKDVSWGLILPKIQSCSNNQNGCFLGFKMIKINFTQNMSGRKMLTFPHCVFPIRLPQSVPICKLLPNYEHLIRTNFFSKIVLTNFFFVYRFRWSFFGKMKLHPKNRDFGAIATIGHPTYVLLTAAARRWLCTFWGLITCL